MDELAYGPNGGLVYAMEYLYCHKIKRRKKMKLPLVFYFTNMRYLIENMEWFLEELGDYDDDYLIIDCPGK